MAHAIDFIQRNDYIGKPANMTDHQCYALPVCRIVTFIPGPDPKEIPVCVPAHVSCWQLTEEEKAEVAKYGLVYIKILGKTLFPMSVHGQNPIDLANGKFSDYVITKDELDQP